MAATAPAPGTGVDPTARTVLPCFDSEACHDRTLQTRAPQRVWAATPIRARLRILRALRHLLAENAEALTRALPATLARIPADTLAAEVLPLLAACRFLEQNAARILAPRRLGRRGLPFWLSGIDATVERMPFGTVLVIGPSNYPLFLPGAQTLQALAAGNAVVWKPGRAGEPAARLFARLAQHAGLPEGILRVTDDSIETTRAEIAHKPAKIVFTGSSQAGKAVLQLAAQHAIPVIAELSGCDAVFALPSADPDRLAQALTFGMRLNGSATCMAPRRLILIGPPQKHQPLLRTLEAAFAEAEPVFLRDETRAQLTALLEDTRAHGATPSTDPTPLGTRPVLIRNGRPAMQLAQADLFAPVLTVLHAEDTINALAIDAQCPTGLTAGIFGDEREARELARTLQVGNIVINDLIVPTADPRIPFGGRHASGFGTTRGAEGLLEMTAARTTSVRKNNSTRHFQPTTGNHAELFYGVVALTHTRTLAQRLAGLKRIVAAGRHLR